MQVVNLIAVSRLRRMAQKAGLGEVVVMGDKLRVAPATLADSIQIRLQRMYPGAKYHAAASAAIIPLPEKVDDTALIAWVSELLVAIFAAEVAQGTPSGS